LTLTDPSTSPTSSTSERRNFPIDDIREGVTNLLSVFTYHSLCAARVFFAVSSINFQLGHDIRIAYEAHPNLPKHLRVDFAFELYRNAACFILPAVSDEVKAEIATYKNKPVIPGVIFSNPVATGLNNGAGPSNGIVIQRGVRVALPNELPDAIEDCFLFEHGFLNMSTSMIANHIGIKINQVYRELETNRKQDALLDKSTKDLFYFIKNEHGFAVIEIFDTILCNHKLCVQYATVNEINMPVFLDELKNSFGHIWHRIISRKHVIDYKRFMAYCKVEKGGIYLMNSELDASDYLHSYFKVLQEEVQDGTLKESTAKNHFKLTNTVLSVIALTQGFNIDVSSVKKQTGLLDCFDVSVREIGRERGHLTDVNRAVDATLTPGDVKRFINAVFDADILVTAKSRDLARRNHDVMQLQLWVALEFGSGCRGFQVELLRISSLYIHALTPSSRENEITSNCSCLSFDTVINKTKGSGGSQHKLVDHVDVHMDSCFLLSLALNLQCKPYDNRRSILDIICDEMDEFLLSDLDDDAFQFKWWTYHVFGQLNAPNKVRTH